MTPTSIPRLAAPAVALAVTAALSGCSLIGSDEPGAAAATESFCTAAKNTFTDPAIAAALAERRYDDAVEQVRTAADRLADVPPPSDIPDAARAGLEAQVEALQGIGVDDVTAAAEGAAGAAERAVGGAAGAASLLLGLAVAPPQEEDVAAFATYLVTNCTGLPKLPQLPQLPDLPELPQLPELPDLG